VVDDLERVLAASTLPTLLLGGEVGADQNAAFDRWHKALHMPSVHGLVVGRTLLFPPDDDVAGAWRFCDDPAHAWIRGTWAGQPIDPRLP